MDKKKSLQGFQPSQAGCDIQLPKNYDEYLYIDLLAVIHYVSKLFGLLNLKMALNTIKYVLKKCFLCLITGNTDV